MLHRKAYRRPDRARFGNFLLGLMIGFALAGLLLLIA